MSAILIEGDAEGWYESGPVNDVLIRTIYLSAVRIVEDLKMQSLRCILLIWWCMRNVRCIEMCVS